MNKVAGALVVGILLASTAQAAKLEPQDKVRREKLVGINVQLNAPLDAMILTELEAYGDVLEYLDAIQCVTLKGPESAIPALEALAFVTAANTDAERNGGPFASSGLGDFLPYGLSTWNLDAINVTDFGWGNRVVDYDGAGVYVAVIDTGLIHTWRAYFPEERIATEYGIAFEGGGGEQGHVTEVPNLWERDVNSHGTHVTSSILGYWFGPNPINGVAPAATVIPVKVLNQNGSGWSSMVAHGILYVAELKAGPLADHPVVINMSLGGGALDAIEKAAIDYAIAQGVIVVAAAGNEGTRGMSYPGAYAPVIGVAAAAWRGEFYTSNWWYGLDVADPTNPYHFYIASFSSRARWYQDLDVAAPGQYVVGPYQVNQGQESYYYLNGTSMASPHVAGVVALMAQKNPGLIAADAETILENSALAMPAEPAYAAGAGLVDAQAALSLVP